MNAIKRRTGVDLRDARLSVHPIKTLLEQRGGAAYSLASWSSILQSRPCKVLAFHIPRHADVMALHNIDVPSAQIEKIEFIVGDAAVSFRSIEEASFYLHLRIQDHIMRSTYVRIHLRPGFERCQCTITFRCYFVDATARDDLQPEQTTVPVARDILFNGNSFLRRKMAKL